MAYQVSSRPSTLAIHVATISPPFVIVAWHVTVCSTSTVHSRADSSATTISSLWSGGTMVRRDGGDTLGAAGAGWGWGVAACSCPPVTRPATIVVGGGATLSA